MAMWRAGHRSVYELNEWQHIDTFATLLQEVCHELDVSRDKEWLLYLLERVGRLMREVVAESWHREHLAEFILGISEALSFLALIDYYLMFLRHEGYLPVERAQAVTGQLNAVQRALASLAGRLRQALRAGPEGSLPVTPWSRN